MNVATRAHEALSRSHLYGLLARIARAEVDQELLAEFRKPEVAAALASVDADLSLTLASCDDAALIEELALAYTQLFIFTLNPHESVQRGEGQLWGSHTASVQSFMDEIGLAMAAERALLPDHLATELEVMHVLAAAEAEALDAGDEARAFALATHQVRFLREHLAAWGVELFGSAERMATHQFYRVIARLGHRFLFSEAEALLG